MLREVEGLSTIETCESLQLSTEAVRVRLHRARSVLRQYVEKKLGEQVDGLFAFAGTRCDAMVARVFQKLGLPLTSASRSLTAKVLRRSAQLFLRKKETLR